MFMPQSQSHHSRSYGAPSTVRRRGDKENAGALPSKTPSRNALKQVAGPSTGRMLGKTVDRNVLAPKSDAPPPNDDIKPKRLFANVQPPPSTTRPVKPRSVKTPAHAKTPAPYRDIEPEPQPTPLPSAQRTRRRSRNSLVRTPEHQWDQELSLDSIAEVELEPAAAPTVESDYELEYAPPPVKDVPYVPEWANNVPDPVETMTKLGRMRPMLFTAAPSPPQALQPVPMPTLDLCDDDEIEEPMLRKARPAQAVSKPRAALTTKPASRTLGIRGPGGAARPGVPAARPAARAPTSVRPTTLKTTPAAAAVRTAPAKTASSTLRVGVTTKSGATAPIGAPRTVTAPRPAPATRPTPATRSAPVTRPALATRPTPVARSAPTATRAAPAPVRTGPRGVPSKTDTRPVVTRPTAISAVRKPVATTQASKVAARPGVKPSTTTRPALGSKTVGRTTASGTTEQSATVAAPASPGPEFADMDMDFGALDLDLDELEPKIETLPMDLGPEQSPVDLSLLAPEPGPTITPQEAEPSPDPNAEQTLLQWPHSATEPEQATKPKDVAQSAGIDTEHSPTALPTPAVEPEPAPEPEDTLSPSAEALAPRGSPSTVATTELTEPVAVATASDISEDDFEVVDPALAPAIPSANLVFDAIPEENEFDVSEDMSLESI